MQKQHYMHCGAETVPFEALALVPVTTASRSYQPIPHHQFVENVRFVLTEHGYEVGEEKHAISRGGLRYFGTIQLNNSAAADKDFGWVVGLRNSHDKRFPAGLAVGSRVFVCDNLSFSGEIVVARKHTTHLFRDLPKLVNDTVGRLNAAWQNQDAQFAAYKAAELNEAQVNDLLIKSLELGVVGAPSILPVLKEWKQPQHKEFEPRTAWSLFNSFTEIMKEYQSFTLVNRTRGLHHILDTFIKFSKN
jgi:hypothetical protein